MANLTETDLAEALMRKGVAKKEIVLGFLEPLVKRLPSNIIPQKED